jgi:hypothetical protein
MEQEIYSAFATFTIAVFVLTIFAVIVGLIWLRFFAARPCTKIKSVEHSPDGLVIFTMADGTTYLKFGDKR